MSRYFSWASVVGSECELSNTEIECALCALCKNRVALLFKPVEGRGREERGAELNLSLIRTWIWVNPWGIPQNQLWRALFHIHRTDTHMHNEKTQLIWLNFTKTVFALLAFYTNRGAKKNLAAFSCCFCSKIDWLDDCREREREDSERECP